MIGSLVVGQDGQNAGIEVPFFKKEVVKILLERGLFGYNKGIWFFKKKCPSALVRPASV